MKWTAYKQVPIDRPRCDVADIKRRMKQPHVIALAANIAALGDEPQHAPVVQAKTWKLACGRDRLAACLLNKKKRIWVHVAEATTEEMADLEESENLYRRPVENRSELLAARVAKVSGVLRAVAAQGVTASQPAEQTIKAQARKQVAREAGVTTAAVRQAEVRAAAKTGSGAAAGPGVAESAENPSATEPPPPIHTFGLPLDPALAAALAMDKRAWDLAANHLKSALGALAPLKETTAEGARIYEEVKRLGAAARAQRACTLCWWCKGFPELAATCHPCGGVGVLREGAASSIEAVVPVELKAEGAAACVQVGGRFVLCSALGDMVIDAADGREVVVPGAAVDPDGPPVRAPSPPRNGTRSIRIVDDAGAPVVDEGEDGW